MWLLAANLPVRLEALDQTGNPLAGLSARLHHLDEEHAVMILDEPNPARCFHWGAPIRFNLEDGLRRYEFTGVIVQRNNDQPNAMASDSAPEAAQKTCEIRIRIWECHSVVQRRNLPRRKLRFPVQFRSACDDAMEDESDVPAETFSGWCVDIGGGGMRLRTDRLIDVPARLSLQFRLPISGGAGGTAQEREFCLYARVIRAQVCGRHSDSMEIALRFERLPVADGLVLKNLLA